LADGVVEQARLSAWVQGRVQGVGYRYWIRGLARDLGLRGSATNLPDGRVAFHHHEVVGARMAEERMRLAALA